jgi:hypothetical protein
MKKILICCVITIAAFGCSSDKRSYERSADSTQSNLEAVDSLAEAKVIKTADMRFKVKNVQETKENLSAVIKGEGGMVAEFSVNSVVQRTEQVKYSADSLLDLTSYGTEGLIVARIPSDKLDDFTNKVAKLAVFIDSQSMKQDDQSMVYLSNKLKSRNRVEAVEQLNKHATKKSNNVETSLNVKDDYVDRKIENLAIDNQVKYSTITLNFYQPNTVKKLMVGNDNLYDYRPGFLNRFWMSIQNGWTIFKEFLLLLATIWVWILIGTVGYIFYKQYRKKQKISS